ncbi:class I SAM-dependent methyltransferase [Geminicoccus roseus]|uniref:class I SAM-dependent methyltransferase n=1 Tax=Geminicoccus roseus TaxID=404900 RepID=UPI00047F6EFD|nr:class I SAM-dependent methyltransferase [Geminicoccus roseus]
MTGFAADWLNLREPYDSRARDPELLARLAEWAQGRRGLRAVDLGAGTGSAFRALDRHLPDDTLWTLVEHDPVLIATGQALMPPGGRVRYRQADLSCELDQVLTEDVDLLTASALIDLVSDPWLDGLAERVLDCRCAVWIGLTYDSDLSFEPSLPEDSRVRQAFDRDMTRDKGFGRALGGGAHEALMARLQGRGRLCSGRSPWLLGAEDGPIIHALIDGIADAAHASTSWRGQRHATTTGMRVGHSDLLFLPEA